MTENDDNETNIIIRKGDGMYKVLESAVKFVGNGTHGECYNHADYPSDTTHLNST